MININDFFYEMTGFQPTEDQKQLLTTLVNMDAKKIIISAGRQSGKTLCCVVVMLWFIFKYAGKLNILLISAQKENAFKIHLDNILRNHKELEEKILNSGTYNPTKINGFQSVDGSAVFIRGVTDKQIRGLPADIVIIDEAAEVKNEMILTAMGNLSGEVSKFILLSTPHVKNSLFVEWATDKKSGFKYHNWSAENLSWHNPEIQKTKKKEFTTEQYSVEVLGVPPTKAERAFFPSKHITACCKPFVEKEGGPNSQIEIGIDWGMVSGTTLAVVERLGPRVKVLHTQQWVGKAIEFIAPEIRTIIDEWKPILIKADAKPDDYQDYMRARYPKLVIKYINANLDNNKTMLLSQIKRAVEKHLLEISEDKLNIIIQFRKYKRDMRRGDDFVDAIALANYKSEIFQETHNVYIGVSKNIKNIGVEYKNVKEREIRY